MDVYFKLRVTHDMSSLSKELGRRKNGVSTNSGIPKSQKKGIPLIPRAPGYPRTQAVCTRALTGCDDVRAPRAGVYGVDKREAYCFEPVQAEDQCTGFYLWTYVDGKIRPHLSFRIVFGGASWPDRFERISLLDSAWVQRCQREFDALQPPVRYCAPSPPVGGMLIACRHHFLDEAR